nr:mechanosensitive ion channel family protein [uncultured Kingella sp.]
MLNTLHQWFAKMPLSEQWIFTLLLFPLVWLVKAIWLYAHFKSHPNLDLEHKRRALVLSRNVSLILILMGLLMVWGSQIQTFALSMVALAAATVVATKELIMCLSGSLLRFATRQYSVGDYIEIAHMRGRVVDINMFNTLMMQIAENPHVGHLSGRTVSFPNSLLLSHTVQRDNILGAYIVHTFEIPVPIHLNPDVIVPRLQAVLDELCSPYTPAIVQYFEAVQVQQHFFTPAARTRISRVPNDDKTYKLVVRFASPVTQQLDIQQAVLDEFIRLQYQLLSEQSNPPLNA